MNKLPTPRTDAAEQIRAGSFIGSQSRIVTSKFARTLERELQQAKDYADRLVEHKDMVCLPADLKNLREANAHFAVENEMLKNAMANDRDAARAEGFEIEQEIKAITEQRDMWKSNHNNQVKINQLLRDRPDLKDRAKSIDKLIEERDRLAEALRKAISWGDSASHHILYRENINWTYLDEAKETLQSITRQTEP